jgi:uncharacterized protein YkwD
MIVVAVAIAGGALIGIGNLPSASAATRPGWHHSHRHSGQRPSGTASSRVPGGGGSQRPTTTPSAPAGTQSPTTAPAPAPTGSSSTQEAAVVDLVNVERAKAGCAALRNDSRLATAARGHSTDMATRNYFSHDTPEGVSFATRITNAGYQWSGAAENIAAGQSDATSVMNSWMNSSGHRANILNCGYKDLGVGLAAASGGKLYWTQDFGSPR